MKVTNTYITKNKEERKAHQAELHRRCILLLRLTEKRGQK